MKAHQRTTLVGVFFQITFLTFLKPEIELYLKLKLNLNFVGRNTNLSDNR
jgi:hypothetical protein